MKLQTVFKKTKKNDRVNIQTPSVPDGFTRKCPKCGAIVFSEEVKENHYTCPKCGGYFRMHAMQRINSIVDKGSFEPLFTDMKVENPLDVKGYEDKVYKLKEKTKLDEAITTGIGTIRGEKIAIAVCDSRFMMASMGHIVGEKLTSLVEKATKENLPVVVFACSGGARMQEGMVSLMQMAKTSAALKRHSESGNLYISVLTDPTTGGVTASFAMLGDIILAEPKALIGFAGPRVIEQTIGQKLPEGFQSAEFLLEHGFVDSIVERKNMRKAIRRILEMHRKDNSAEIDAATVNEVLNKEYVGKENDDLAPWDRVQISRATDRPVGGDYIKALFTKFMELHGDRYFKDDRAIVGGIGKLNGIPVTVIAQCKGKNTAENIKRNFGMPSPDGYRKALRLMKQAEKFNRPIICFVDTPGAFCGLEAEERGQGEAIARNLFEMSSLKVPVITVVIGEGGSGGALAMAVSNRVWMMENSVYSVLSPEGYASILWKDSKRAAEAADEMKLTSYELKKLHIIDEIIEEPEEFTKETMTSVVEVLSNKLTAAIKEMSKLVANEIVDDRYTRFRKY